MALVHEKSTVCSIHQLELFDPLVTCAQVVKSQSVPHYALNAVTPNTNVLEFLIQGSGDQYVDLMRTRLYLKCKITGGADGQSDLQDGAKVAPVPNLIASMFAQCDVFLNDKMVTSSNNLYAYRGYLDTVLNFPQETTNRQLTAQMFYLDTSGAHDTDVENNGFKFRQYFSAKSREFVLEGPLYVDLCNQGRYLLNNVDVRIRLSRQPDKFCLMDLGDNPKAVLNIQQAILKVQKITLDPGAQLGIETYLRNHNAIYNIMRGEPKMFTIGAGNTTFTREHISLGLSPKYAIIGLVGTDAFLGNYKRNPFKFESFDLKQISLNVDGEQIPVNGINMQFGTSEPHNVVEGYMSLIQVCKKWQSNEAFMFSMYEYMRGNILYGFEIAPEIVPGAFNLVRNTNIRLDIQFAKALTSNISVLVYFHYDDSVNINMNREVFLSHGV
jgi:hypothetical protein